MMEGFYCPYTNWIIRSSEDCKLCPIKFCPYVGDRVLLGEVEG